MPIKTSPEALIKTLVEYGLTAVFCGIALFLLFYYFWKMINKKTFIEKSLEETLELLRSNQISLVEIKTKLSGGFRNRGVDDDD